MIVAPGVVTSIKGDWQSIVTVFGSKEKVLQIMT